MDIDIYPLLQCQSFSGSVVRAFDQYSEDPGSNLAESQCLFSSKIYIVALVFILISFSIMRAAIYIYHVIVCCSIYSMNDSS